jgi:hypothetical protein
LAEAERLARQHAVPFLLLVASDHRLHGASGFRNVAACCRRLATDAGSGCSHSVMEEDMGAEMLFKATGSRAWPEGDVDLLGYLF